MSLYLDRVRARLHHKPPCVCHNYAPGSPECRVTFKFSDLDCVWNSYRFQFFHRYIFKMDVILSLKAVSYDYDAMYK